ncbi:MAG: alpha/beta hydrolase [Sedimenticola sp.]|nr:alpha/beta hydrolase [Sedimenticola sp.]
MLTLLLVLAGLYATLVAAVYLGQSSLLYLPSRTLAATPAQIGLDYEALHITTGDGVRLHGWYLPATRSRGTLLFFHGNAGNISHRLDSLRIFHDLRLNVLLFDYRGYGESEGHPDEAGTYHDAEAAWDYLVTQRGESPRRIVLFGRSLGASVAAWLAARREPAVLILESAFISVPELAADLYPWLPARWLARLHYPTRDYLAQARSPVLVAHSPQDEIIPYRHGQAVYRAAPEPRQFLPMLGDHNSGFLQTGAHYRETLEQFLTRHLPAT